MSSDWLYFLLRVVFTLFLLLGLVVIVRAMLQEVAQSAAEGTQESTEEEHEAALILIDPGSVPYSPGSQWTIWSPTVIGRGPGSQILLDDSSVSTQHASIEWTKSQWVLSDLQSRNGTTVNGQPVGGSVGIIDGDLVSFGRVETRFVC